MESSTLFSPKTLPEWSETMIRLTEPLEQTSIQFPLKYLLSKNAFENGYLQNVDYFV